MHTILMKDTPPRPPILLQVRVVAGCGLRVVMDKKEREQILLSCHATPTSGHLLARVIDQRSLYYGRHKLIISIGGTVYRWHS